MSWMEILNMSERFIQYNPLQSCKKLYRVSENEFENMETLNTEDRYFEMEISARKYRQKDVIVMIQGVCKM